MRALVEKSVITTIALAAWLGLGLQLYATMTHPNLADISPLQRLVRYFEYFTILTNLIVALGLSIYLATPNSKIGRFVSGTGAKTAIAVYIAMVGIVYNVVLQNAYEFEGAARTADVLTHDLVPLAYVGYWLLFVPKGELSWKSPFVWLLYPLLYLTYVMIRAMNTGRYPYPFLDVGNLGFASVLVNSFFLAGTFYVAGLIFVGVDAASARLRGRMGHGSSKPSRGPS